MHKTFRGIFDRRVISNTMTLGSVLATKVAFEDGHLAPEKFRSDMMEFLRSHVEDHKKPDFKNMFVRNTFIRDRDGSDHVEANFKFHTLVKLLGETFGYCCNVGSIRESLRGAEKGGKPERLGALSEALKNRMMMRDAVLIAGCYALGTINEVQIRDLYYKKYTGNSRYREMMCRGITDRFVRLGYLTPLPDEPGRFPRWAATRKAMLLSEEIHSVLTVIRYT
jgi:hypothetical protein